MVKVKKRKKKKKKRKEKKTPLSFFHYASEDSISKKRKKEDRTRKTKRKEWYRGRIESNIQIYIDATIYKDQPRVGQSRERKKRPGNEKERRE